jgi:hypothetical protein
MSKHKIEEDEIEAIFHALNSNERGEGINYSEFLSAVVKPQHMLEEKNLR